LRKEALFKQVLGHMDKDCRLYLKGIRGLYVITQMVWEQRREKNLGGKRWWLEA
jgi:hypothetical protein